MIINILYHLNTELTTENKDNLSVLMLEKFKLTSTGCSG